MKVGETFAVGETVQVVGNVSASRFAGIFNGTKEKKRWNNEGS